MEPTTKKKLWSVSTRTKESKTKIKWSISTGTKIDHCSKWLGVCEDGIYSELKNPAGNAGLGPEEVDPENSPDDSMEVWVKKDKPQVQRPLQNTVMVRETVLMISEGLQEFNEVEALRREYTYQLPQSANETTNPHYINSNFDNPYAMVGPDFIAGEGIIVDDRNEYKYDIVDEPPPLPPRNDIKHTPQVDEPPPLPPRNYYDIKHTPQVHDDTESDSFQRETYDMDDFEDDIGFQASTEMSLLKQQSILPIDDEINESRGILSASSTNTYRKRLLQHDTVDRHEPEGTSSFDDEATTPKQIHDTVNEDTESDSFRRELNEMNDFENDRGVQSSIEMYLLKPQSVLPIYDGICESGGEISTSSIHTYRKTLLQQGTVDRHEPEGMSSVDDDGTTPKQVIDTGKDDSFTNTRPVHAESYSSISHASSSESDEEDTQYFPCANTCTSTDTIGPLDDTKKATCVDSGESQPKTFVVKRPPGYENHKIGLEHDFIGDLAPKQAMTPTFRKPIPTPRRQRSSNVYDREENSGRCCEKNEFTADEGSLVRNSIYLKNKKDALQEDIKLQESNLNDEDQVYLLLVQKLKNEKQLVKKEIMRNDLETEIMGARVHVQMEEYYQKFRPVSTLPDYPTAVTNDTFIPNMEESGIAFITKMEVLNMKEDNMEMAMDESGIGESLIES